MKLTKYRITHTKMDVGASQTTLLTETTEVDEIWDTLLADKIDHLTSLGRVITMCQKFTVEDTDA